MTVGAILTVGLGAPFGSVNLLLTLGYLSGAAPAPPADAVTWRVISRAPAVDRVSRAPVADRRSV